MILEVKEVLDRAAARDDRQRDRFGEMKEQLARMEEHHRSTDKRVDDLKNNVEALRAFKVVMKQTEES